MTKPASSAVPNTNNVSEAEVPLDRDVFLRNLIRELSGTLEDVVGIEDASGYISVVGQNIGRGMCADYKAALGVETLSRQQVEEVLIDLKRRIRGDFYVIESSDEKVVFGNRRCPFEDRVLNRESMCMMTSNVFGSISADNLGYAKVILNETIARGDAGCKVTVYFKQSPDSKAQEGREYFKSTIGE